MPLNHISKLNQMSVHHFVPYFNETFRNRLDHPWVIFGGICLNLSVLLSRRSITLSVSYRRHMILPRTSTILILPVVTTMEVVLVDKTPWPLHWWQTDCMDFMEYQFLCQILFMHILDMICKQKVCRSFFNAPEHICLHTKVVQKV